MHMTSETAQPTQRLSSESAQTPTNFLNWLTSPSTLGVQLYPLPCAVIHPGPSVRRYATVLPLY